jgi:hypothetical protein
MVARLNERGGKWVLTWPRIIPVQRADTEEAGKWLAISSALAVLPFVRSPVGAVLRAIRDNPVRAEQR